ncbi:MAG: sortase [Acidimicrobiia bacterium]
MRRIIQIFGWTLIWSGVFVFGYLGWQLVGTDVVNAGIQEQAQEELKQALEKPEEELPDVEQIDPFTYLGGDTEVLGSDTEVLPEPVKFSPEEIPDIGEGFAFLRIDKIGLDAVIFEGVDPQTLKSGPGHTPGSPLPGQPGNAVLAGHRTTYGRPFWDFDLLEIGDRIEVESAIGVSVYEVREIAVVQPTDVWVTDDRPGAWLTMTTCEPKFSARQRLVIWAEMVSGPNLEYAALQKEKFGDQT